MRAWVFTSKGKPANVLKLRDDLPTPTTKDVKPDEVIVKVLYVGICQGMTNVMRIFPHTNNNPWIPEIDFSGVVTGKGAQVQHLTEGDAIFGGLAMDTFVKYNGVLAEYIIVPAALVCRKPENMSFEEAGGMTAVGCTAVQFAEVTKMQPGQRVLVTGASSGTGTIVVQVAKAAVGKEGVVVGTCSAANEELVRNLGVDEVSPNLYFRELTVRLIEDSGNPGLLIRPGHGNHNCCLHSLEYICLTISQVVDYRSYPVLHEHLAERYSSDPFDVIIDIVGSDEWLYEKSPAYLKPKGVFLFAGQMQVSHADGGVLDILKWLISIMIRSKRPLILGGIPQRCFFHSGRADKESLNKLAAMIASGQVRGVTDSVWEMEDVLKGYERLATSRARGRVMIHVQN